MSFIRQSSNFRSNCKTPIEICTEEEISICIYVYLILISIQFVLFFCTNFDVSKNCVLRSLPVPLPRRSHAYCFSRLWQTEDNANKKFTNGCQYKFIETIITTEKYTLQDTDKGTLRFTTSISLTLSPSIPISIALTCTNTQWLVRFSCHSNK